MNKESEQVQSILSFRANAIQAVAVTLGLALGVNLLASGLILQTQWSGTKITWIGLAVVIAISILIAVKSTPKLKRRIRLEGVLAVETADQAVLPISNYSFSEDVARYIRGLSTENKALGKAWAETPLSGVELPKNTHSTPDEFPKEAEISVVRVEMEHTDTPSARLAREVTEYFVLDQLSLHLSDYFREELDSENAEIHTLQRRDIPHVLLDNHFLELFSRPIEDRDAFSRPKNDEKKKGEVFTIFTGDGAIYDRFELALPRGSKVLRLEDGAVEIRTKRFSLSIGVEFEGWGASLPADFYPLYLQRDFRKVSAYKVGLSIGIKFDALSFLTRSGWEYFQWLDSFLNELQSVFSFERFIERIGWETARTAALIDRNILRMKAAAQKNKEDAAKTNTQELIEKDSSDRAH